MRFEQLRYLEAALRTGSFRQAGRELGVSQPTITTQVQRLEEDLGVVLVVRGVHGVRATDAAELILPHAEAAIRAEDLMRQEASAVGGLTIGSVRIATVATGSTLVLPNVIKRLHDDYPNIRFEVAEGSTAMVRSGVASGDFGVGLVTRIGIDEVDEAEDQLTYTDLVAGRLVLCVPDAHRLAQADRFDASDLDGEPLIFFGKGSILRAAYEKLVSGFQPRVVYTADNAMTAQRMVRVGVGISLANTAEPSTRSGKGVTLLPIDEPWARTMLSVVVRKNEMRGPVVQTLLRLIREDSSTTRPSRGLR